MHDAEPRRSAGRARPAARLMWLPLVLPLLLIALAAPGCDAGGGAVPASISGGASVEPADGAATGDAAPAAAIETDPLHPVVRINTTLGAITVRLDAELAPGTVTNFLNYVNSSHYDQTIFHYADAESLILGGGYTRDLAARPEFTPVRNEAHNGLSNKRGTIAMARDLARIDSSTCQFFINVVDNPHLDHAGEEPKTYGYCVFGKVTEGLDVVDRIAATATRDKGEFLHLPREPVVIESARVGR